ncbi:MAG: sodium:proton antiporter [Chloroflexota bacterium]|nr:sodium:proton antiporter [Chloroflexota bacterium]MDE2682949.1 sodium:proton antiporter [Chloroflexota bacterium]
MRTVLVYSILLFLGLGLSQGLPAILGDFPDVLANGIRVLTLTGLAFIMIRVGFEFHIEKSNLGQYGWDYLVAFTAASFPWIFVTGYFVFVMLPPEFWASSDAWKESLLAGRFAAPTSAGVLFSMLAAAGLGATWLFRKARILAIFDDLDTVLLMIPLKMLMVGIAWQLGATVVVMAVLLIAAYIWLHRLPMPVTWRWVLLYAALIVGASELLYAWGKLIDPTVPIHIEILLPAFVVGCLARPRGEQHADDDDAAAVEHALHEAMERPSERRAAWAVSATFMVLVGLSMPLIFGGPDAQHPAHSESSLHAAAPASAVDDPAVHGGAVEGRYTDTITARQPSLSWTAMAAHVLALTVLSNLGKMFPALCYRREAHWKERLALAIGMWPRGEVGAGVLVLSLSYGIGGPIVTVAMLSLALNLALTGVFILAVRKLIEGVPDASLKSMPDDLRLRP